MVLYRVFRDIVPKIRFRRIATVKNPSPVSLSTTTVDVQTTIQEDNFKHDRDGLDKLIKQTEATINVAAVKKQPWKINDLIKIPYYILKKFFVIFRWFIMGLISPLRYVTRKIFYRNKPDPIVCSTPLEPLPKTEKNDVPLKIVTETNAQSAEDDSKDVNNNKEVKSVTRAEKWANAKLKISKFLMYVGAFTCITWIVDIIMFISSPFGESGPPIGTRSSFRNDQRRRARSRLAGG